MDKYILFVEAPELDDDTVEKIYYFLQDIVLAFESHYYPQLVRSQSNCQPLNSTNGSDEDVPFNDEIPF